MAHSIICISTLERGLEADTGIRVIYGSNVTVSVRVPPRSLAAYTLTRSDTIIVPGFNISLASTFADRSSKQHHAFRLVEALCLFCRTRCTDNLPKSGTDTILHSVGYRDSAGRHR
jgi:hypothetical protein